MKALRIIAERFIQQSFPAICFDLTVTKIAKNTEMTYDRHVPYWYFVKVLVCRRIKFVLLCLRRAILQGIWSTTEA